ncbi:hypothetical protein HN419_04865 [Candidatus Woesearchaeota archaeon]|jgi:transcriptional regulator of acetoin/glycerol metabolism|nr:hypothetical protein [Candidatus Woesearchaeota archaeon]MBT3537792.1 hypothetical protein [Candidatus Woesearchaeota archaeon]MBT4697923.1 hypothetical protein [Candidatus Woesearchaeota archaeon]MBT4717304.1 hypothetical protein [Candidatus Woesearchaeota archaeon]MBT7105461.1 hypothetical protein [Candidatus Woesearchaeota archaeon]
MVEHRDLEREVRNTEKIVSEAMHRIAGVTIAELNKDITAKLEKNPLFDFKINTNIPFKTSKKLFKKEYLRRLLQTNLGNISLAAKVADIDRRSIHRLINETGIEVGRIREEMIRPYEIKREAVNHMIENALDQYRTIIHPDKLKEMYRGVSEVSEDILEDLPVNQLTMKEAEEEFEKAYLRKALEDARGSVTKAARKIGLRYETLHRKAKKLGIVE